MLMLQPLLLILIKSVQMQRESYHEYMARSIKEYRSQWIKRPTDNQRIDALEKKIEELEELVRNKI